MISKASKEFYQIDQIIFDAHAKLGFPELSKEVQFDILDNENFDHIKKLTEYEEVPVGLLNHYITVDPTEYLNHLRSLDLATKMDIAKQKDKSADGSYIFKKNGKWHYIFNERGSKVSDKKFKTLDALLWHIAYFNLTLYAPKYRKTMSKNYAQHSV